eukprot:354671-Pyramimonas_sp.AAC.1
MSDVREDKIILFAHEGDTEAYRLAKVDGTLARRGPAVGRLAKGMSSIAHSLCRCMSRAGAHYADLGVFDNIGTQGLTIVSLEGDAEMGGFVEEVRRGEEAAAAADPPPPPPILPLRAGSR